MHTNLPKLTHEEQIARVCQFDGCTVSLAYGVRQKKWCSEHSDTGRRALNKIRRQKEKNLERPASYRTDLPYSVALTESMTILYEDYKEPLRRVSDERGDGFGYMGTIAMSEDREYLQCHICGNLFRSVSSHVKAAHDITVGEYKKEYGLSSSTALIGESMRYDNQQLHLSNGRNNGQPEHLKAYVNRLKSGEQKMAKKGDYSLEWRNKKGLCPDQVLEKILDLKEKIGHVPSYEEFYTEYNGRFLHSIKYLHGSWSEAVRKLGEKTREDLRRHSGEDLIEELQNFKLRYDRIPMTSDFNRGLLTNKGTFIRKFGTLNNARIAAGMNAVVPLGGKFGNYKELEPDEYAKYLEGHGISANAKRLRSRRRKE